jgi:2-oxo-4-hydroxy-4-carboxy-5-ureidoimidazoline decarboxylase
VTPDEVNALGRDAFVERFGGVAEGSPWVAEAAWEARPFESRGALVDAFLAAVREAPPERGLALIRAHPDLGERVAAGTDSAREQSSAGLDRLALEEREELLRLNAAYRERFGFPFVVCVAGLTPAAVVASLRRRLAEEPAAERRTALEEVGKIVRLRLERM